MVEVVWRGHTGYTGATGPSDFVHPDGSTGVTGVSGPSSEEGQHHPNNSPGVGTQHLRAEDKRTGPSGYTGATGWAGYTGLTGATGATGNWLERDWDKLKSHL